MNRVKCLKQKKAISPIIATLLLILIAIAAGVVVYAYVIGFVGNSTSNTGGATNTLSIDQVALSSKVTSFPATAYVRNLGPAAEGFNTGYFIKSGSLNIQVGPAISVACSTSSCAATFTIPTTGFTLTGNGINGLIIAVSVTTCTGSGTLTATGFGTSINLGTCASGTWAAATTPTLALPAGVIVPTTLVFTTGTVASQVTSGTTSYIYGTAESPTATGSIAVPINSMFPFTLAQQGLQAANPLSSGQSYTVSIVGIDGATATLSGKAA